MSDPIREALSSETYERAFRLVMQGTALELLSDDEQQALRTARDAVGEQGPGFPMPWRLDPTRSRAIAP